MQESNKKYIPTKKSKKYRFKEDDIDDLKLIFIVWFLIILFIVSKCTT